MLERLCALMARTPQTPPLRNKTNGASFIATRFTIQSAQASGIVGMYKRPRGVGGSSSFQHAVDLAAHTREDHLSSLRWKNDS